MFNNTTTDFYPVLLDDNFFRVFCLTVSGLIVVTGCPFLCSIIWYEKYGLDKTRTIINMLVARIAGIKIQFLLLVQVLEMARYTFGPLPDVVCLGQNILRDSFVFISMLHLDAIMMARYLFIFWLKNPAAFQHDFWFTVVSTWIHVVGFLIYSIHYLSSPYRPTVFYVCNGESYEGKERKLAPTLVWTVLASFLLISLIQIRIYVFRKRSPVVPQAQGPMDKTVAVCEIEKHSIFDFALAGMLVLLNASSVLNYHILKKLSLEEFNKYPFFLMAYYRSLMVPSLGMICVFFIFLRKENFREIVWQEIRIKFFTN